jgi:hypothetical protein
MIDPSLRLTLAAEAALAPSVHNVQPARWRFAKDGLLLFEDRSRRLAAGDPEGRDAAFSLGAAAEGMAIALSRHGLLLEDLGAEALPPAEGQLVPVRRFAIATGGTPDPLADTVDRRQSYRGRFLPPGDGDRAVARALAREGVEVIAEPERIILLARLCDDAGLAFLRDGAFRAELLSWMRLSRRNPRWSLDGLNAEAMAMSLLEAMGAKAVLGGRLFQLLDGLGLGRTLTSEASTIATAAAVVIVHHPVGADEFDCGRSFYRLWLHIAASGFSAAVMASLADHPQVSATLAEELNLPDERRMRTALRIGRASPGSGYRRARLPAEAALV